MQSKKKKPYTGALARPIILPVKPDFSALRRILSPEDRPAHDKALEQWKADAVEAACAQEAEKYQLLFQHYGIDPTDPERCFLLAQGLARRHVKGFSVKSQSTKRGAGKKWNSKISAQLYYQVRQIIKKRAANGKRTFEIEACRQLSKQEPWKAKCKGAPKTLYNRYLEAQLDPVVRAVLKMTGQLTSEVQIEAVWKHLLD